MVTICADSSTCPTGRSICATHCSSALNAFCYLVAKGDWCVIDGHTPLALSAFPRFRQFSRVGVLQGYAAIFQRQICLRPRLLRLWRAICHSARRSNALRECGLLARYQPRRFSLQFVVPASRGHCRSNDTVPLTSGDTTRFNSPVGQRLTPSPRNVIHHQRHFLRLCRLYAGYQHQRWCGYPLLRLYSFAVATTVVAVRSLSRYPALVRLASAVKLSSRFPAHRFVAPVAISFAVFYYTDDALASPYHPLIAPLATFANPA